MSRSKSALLAVFSLVFAAAVLAMWQAPQQPQVTPPPPPTQAAPWWGPAAVARGDQLMEEFRQANERVQQRVAAMNAAPTQAQRIDAMQEVLNEMSRQREGAYNRAISAYQVARQRIMTGPPPGQAGAGRQAMMCPCPMCPMGMMQGGAVPTD